MRRLQCVSLLPHVRKQYLSQQGNRWYHQSVASNWMPSGHVRRNLWLRIASKQLELMHKY
jgi:hypothetical protein